MILLAQVTEDKTPAEIASDQARERVIRDAITASIQIITTPKEIAA